MEPVWILQQTVIAAHDESLAEHGGSTGIRDARLLESALARPRNLLAYSEEEPTLQRLAAAYAFGIVTNHPFVDGNKRAALIASFTFLRLNRLELTAFKADRYRIFYNLAAGTIDEDELVRWFTENAVSTAEASGGSQPR